MGLRRPRPSLRRLYRDAGFATFEDYLDQRWNLSRTHGYELMDGARVSAALSAMAEELPSPPTERVARELAPLVRQSPERAAEVWRGLPEALKKHVGTAEDVRSSSKAMTEDHLRAISGVVLPLELSPWLTTEAARKLGLETAPVVVHSGLTDDDVARLSDQDNENDEYHLPVSPIDVWREYARLRDEEGWTQARIGVAKGVSQKTVSVRLKLHGLPNAAKAAIRRGDLSEAHLEEISALYVDEYLSPWLTTEAAWVELAEAVVRDRAKNGAKSVAATRAGLHRKRRTHGAQVEAGPAGVFAPHPPAFATPATP